MIDLKALRKDPEKYERLILKKDPKFPFNEFYIKLLLMVEYDKLIEETRGLKKKVSKMIYKIGKKDE